MLSVTAPVKTVHVFFNSTAPRILERIDSGNTLSMIYNNVYSKETFKNSYEYNIDIRAMPYDQSAKTQNSLRQGNGRVTC